jgi:Na+/proline symporter
MSLRKKITGWSMTIVGFILSPLSWWNDVIVNIPLAYLFALPFGLIHKKIFLPAMIVGYWLTNIIGFILMHHGVRQIMTDAKQKSFKTELIKNGIISLVYTAIIIFCIQMGWLKFLPEYIQ